MSELARILDPVTSRWTGALFNLARRAGALEAVQRDVERIGSEVANPAVKSFLVGGNFARRERLASLDGLLVSFHPLTRSFVRLAFDRRREEILLHLAEAFRRRMLEESGVLEGVVLAPRTLGSLELGRLEQSLGARLGKRVRLESRVQPELVAGVRVYVGARMIDWSVQGRLEGLRRVLQEAPLPVPAG